MHDGSIMGGGMWLGMEVWWILILVLVALGIAALARYLFGGRS